MKASILLVAMVLGGCQLTRSDELAADAQACQSAGLREGTREMEQCRASKDAYRQGLANSYIMRQQEAPLILPTQRQAITCNHSPNQTVCN
jgi:hypothetical protein